MSPPRRRSSRLKAAATPKTKNKKATPELDPVTEVDHTEVDLVAAEPDDVVAPRGTPGSAIASARKATTPRGTRPTTPVSSAIKPSSVEMHPNKFRVSMGEPSSALRLGFSDIKPKAEGPGAELGTPSRSNKAPQGGFTFRFGQETDDASLNLGENAQRLLADLRDSVNRYKAEMVATREAEQEAASERRIAQPKGKSGRFSAAHMAEFKKMDSIEGHASAWRANRKSPVKAELQGSASKPSLNTSSTPVKAGLKRSRSNANLDATPQSHHKSASKATPSQASEAGASSQKKKIVLSALYTKPLGNIVTDSSSSSYAKRIKKSQDQDASSARPLSRGDGRSQNEERALGTASARKPFSGFGSVRNKSTISLVEPDTESTGSPKPAASSESSKIGAFGRRILSPRGMQKVKSILRTNQKDTEGGRTAIPKPTITSSQTPGPQRTDRILPPQPLTTPRRKLVKQVSFTPDTKRAAATQDTPSPKKTVSFKGRLAQASVRFASMDRVLTDSQTEPTSGEIVYPDLSGFGKSDGAKDSLSQSVAGTFTFRSDHTIDLNGTPTSGFGASPGQASLRQVRTSTAPKSSMPGGFPEAPHPSSHPNKENAAPPSSLKKVGAPHGMSNKKRHRVTWDEEEAEKEVADRAAKKQKKEHVPEGHALVAPRMLAQTPLGSAKRLQAMRSGSRTPGSPASPSPTKKKASISLSRLNALARPKART